MRWIWIALFVLICDTNAIQTRPVRFVDQKAFPSRHFRHIEPAYSPNFDWEHGLREATVQALFRERIGDHNLKKHIYSAPLLGKQDKATPFGDIAILARGQLYANYAGYTFVQDPYQNDCDDCHNIDIEALRGRCINSHCQIWHPRHNEQLIALWSIKRIRHRSLREGLNRLELEFTVAPVGLRFHKDVYLTKEGTFNYNLPGHVFVLKGLDTHPNLDLAQNVNQFKHGAFIAQTPDGRKYILHSFPGVPTLTEPRYPTTPKDSSSTGTTATTQYSEEDPKKLYQTLLEVLHKKTSLEPTRVTSTPTQKTATTLAETTLVQLPDGQVVPITELQTPFVTKTTPGYVTVRFPETSRPTTPYYPSTIIPQSSQVYTTTRVTRPNDFYTTFVPVPTTTTTKASTTQSTTPETANPPVKMTFHFFAAEEDIKTTATPPRPIFTTISQPLYTTTHNIGVPETQAPTKQIQLPTTQYTDTTRNPTNTRPATIVRVSKPLTESTYQSTEASTKIVPSIPFEATTRFYTSKKPQATFTIPITVLEENERSTLSEVPTPYTTTQFYNPTTKLSAEDDISTILQTTAKDSTVATTTFVRVPHIETTLGVTTVMGSSQNKTTEMVYYAAEETDASTKQSSTTNIESTLPTVVNTETVSTPKRIVTTIGADGSVSVKTTPYVIDEEIFGVTKGSTKTPKPTKSYKVSSTEPSDFLVDDSLSYDAKVPLFKKPLKDYSEDDIFGPTRNYQEVSKKTTAAKEYTKSDVEQALFDNNNRRKVNALARRRGTNSSTTQSTPPKVLYQEFFEASTIAMTSPAVTTEPNVVIVTPSLTSEITPVVKATKRPKLSVSKQAKTTNKEDFTEKTVPVTSQSLLTSITYEINKRKKTVKGSLLKNKFLGSNNATGGENKMMKSMDDIDDFALRLVSQAKGVAYLNEISTTSASTVASTSAKPTKKPKYARRRSYVPRAKRPTRKKVVTNKDSR